MVFKKKDVKKEKVQAQREERVEAPRAVRTVLAFPDRFAAFRHFGVGSMEQLAEKLGKQFHGQSLEELLNG